MTSLKTVNRRVGSIFAVAALVLSTVTPGILPAFASAAQVTERSIELSSTSKEATGVSYRVTFTPAQTAGAFALQFCANSPLIESACTAPAGLDLSSATVASATPGFTKSDATVAANNLTVLTGTIAAATPVVVQLDGVANPTLAGAAYARIVTYTAEAQAQAYTDVDLKVGVRDTGSAAISITDTIGVSAAVLESMTFCVSGTDITDDNCKNKDASPLTAPTIKLGEEVTPDVFALTQSAISTGDLFTQISTNAAGGAVVSLKSTAINCGGLLRAGAPTACDIKPAGATNFTAGEAKFGVMLGTATAPTEGIAANSTGAFKAAAGSVYKTTEYALNYVDENASGITSTFGDAFLDTDGAPVSNRNIKLTFGASVGNSTPAGLYSTNLSLIATGKF